MIEFSYFPYSEIEKYLPRIIELKVSEKARSPGQFLSHYKRDGILNEYWTKKRQAFLTRTYAAYRLNPSLRRWLSMIAWAYRAPMNY